MGKRRRRSHIPSTVKIEGQRVPLAALLQDAAAGITEDILYQRLADGMALVRALTLPPQRGDRVGWLAHSLLEEVFAEVRQGGIWMLTRDRVRKAVATMDVYARRAHVQ